MPPQQHFSSGSVSLPRLARLGVIAALACMALMVPAPAMAAPSSGADLCARVGDRAGFPRDDTLVTAVAIAMAESGCVRKAKLVNGPTQGCPNGSVDRGLWQINSCWHPEVSASCTYRVRCNALAAYRISSGGTDFSPWVTYNTGAYLAFLDEARAAVARIGS